MGNVPPYPTARVVAPVLHERFTCWRDFASEHGASELPIVPDAKIIEEIINVAFWASLRRVEGREPKISIAFIPATHGGNALTFARSLPFEPAIVAGLAPAVERAGIHMGVSSNGGRLEIWGTTLHTPASTFILEVAQAGLLVIKRRRGDEQGKYANVAVLQGDQVRLIDEDLAQEALRRPLIAALLGLHTERLATDAVNITVQLAISMRAHNRGGALLIVPASSDAWRKSIIEPITYEVTPPYDALSALAEAQEAEQHDSSWREAVRKAVDAIAGVTAVDGAAIITDRYALLAFGAKIRRDRTSAPVQQVALSEPLTGAPATVVNISDVGGTRHLSAAQFVQDQQDALALVASQDGQFTSFAWSAEEGMVRAYRLEALLL